MKKYIFLVVIFLTTILSAQEQNPETASKVKELSEFHTVIYKLWHTAWPKKDIKMLSDLLPEIETGAERAKNAKLPGILREKKDRWDIGVNGLMQTLESYSNAIMKKDSVSIINSAELLHSKYEGLVRIIRPVIKEVDQFHQELYMLYHYYMPEKNFEKIITSAIILKDRMMDLEKASLPQKLVPKKDEFNNSVQSLKTAVIKLNDILSNKDDTVIKTATNSVHSRYQALEKIFE